MNTYYQYDSEYLYLRMQTVAPPTFQGVQGRYKWFIDLSTGSPLQKSGNIITGSEYVLFVEDCNDDNQGDTYLIGALSGGGYSQWNPPPCPPQADPSTAGYRLGPGGNFVDLYVNLSALGTTPPPIYQINLAWATDQENPNLEQAPNLDSTEAGDVPISLSGSITIVKDAIPDNAQDFQFSGDLGNFILDDDADPTHPNSLTFGNLPPRTYNVTETVPQAWSLSISGTPSTGNTANINLGPGGNIIATFTNTFVPIAPTIDAIEIYHTQDCLGPAVTSMDPQTTYYAKVRLTSINELSYLQAVQVTLFYDVAGTNPVAPITTDTQKCAILTCTVGTPPSWTIDAGGPPTTWQIVPLSCSQPVDLDTTTGDWIFAFKPGKVATESVAPADWDAQGKATNKANQSGELYCRDKDMNWYGEIDVTTSTVDWGEVPLGLRFTDAPNPKTVSMLYISNGDYYEDIRSEDWTDGVETVTLDETGVDPPPLPGTFALKANDINELSSAVIVMSSIYNHTNDTGGLTTEAGITSADNTLWLSLSETGIAPVQYSGEIYYQIANRD